MEICEIAMFMRIAFVDGSFYFVRGFFLATMAVDSGVSMSYPTWSQPFFLSQWEMDGVNTLDTEYSRSVCGSLRFFFRIR